MSSPTKKIATDTDAVGQQAGTVPARSSHHRLEVRVSFYQVSCQLRLMILIHLLVYYQSSPLLCGQATKANEAHPPGVSLVILCQVLAVALSFWPVLRWYHMEINVGLGVCITQSMFWPSIGFTHTSIQSLC